MSCGAQQDLTICKGKTFSYVLQLETSTIVYKPITAITKAAPVAITATGHGLPDNWRVAIVSVQGMTEINAKNSPPRSTDYQKATVVDPNTITLNKVNSSEFTTYTSGGFVQYNSPMSLAGATARMSIKDAVGGTLLFRLDTTNSRITLNDTLKTITLSITATDTAALTFTQGVYDLEFQDATGVVTGILYGAVTVTDEVTTT